MQRDRGRGFRALSVDRDWCGKDPSRALGRDWCGTDAGGSVDERRALGDWCATEQQSPEPADLGVLLRRVSLRRPRS